MAKSWETRSSELLISIWIMLSSRCDLNCSVQKSGAEGNYAIPPPFLLGAIRKVPSNPWKLSGRGHFQMPDSAVGGAVGGILGKPEEQQKRAKFSEKGKERGADDIHHPAEVRDSRKHFWYAIKQLFIIR